MLEAEPAPCWWLHGRPAYNFASALIVSASLAVGIGPGLAKAPTLPAFVQNRTPMTIRVVRGDDSTCAPDCTEWIALDGPIGPGSAAGFARTIQALGRKRLPVLINSPGGLVSEAMAIGREIRAKHLDVAVTRTLSVSCPADREACKVLTPDGVVTGFAESRDAFCASACSLVLAGGARRFVSPWARVGVHQYVGFARQVKVMRLYRVVTRMAGGTRVEVSRTLIAQRPLPETAVLVRQLPNYRDTAVYFAKMGIDPGIMAMLRSAPSSGIDWLTSEDLTATRLATDSVGGEDLIAQVGAPAVPALAAAKGEPDGLKSANVPASPEIAALIDDAGTQVRMVSGRVTWSVERSADPAGGSGHSDLVATVTLDDDAGTLEFRMRKDETAHGSETLHLVVRLQRGASSPFRTVVAVKTPELRKDAHARPDQFGGEAETSPPSILSLRSDATRDVEQNMALLLADQWIDVPVVIDEGRTLRISFALGASGADAVRRWGNARILRAGL